MDHSPNRSDGKLRRTVALIVKESRQIIRDPSSIAIAVIMPTILILLFGYALSLDVKNVKVAIVLEDSSPTARDVASGFEMSPYFAPRYVMSMPYGEQLMRRGEVEGIIRFRSDFSSQLKRGAGDVQIVVNGIDEQVVATGGVPAKDKLTQLIEAAR